MVAKRLSTETYIQGILAQDRVILSRAITLIESQAPQDQLLAQEVLQGVANQPTNSVRIGITGVPGVGKSTFIEAFGNYILSKNKKLAVLAIDPSSVRTKGSIMGDKTRMATLASQPNAYIRPSPSRGSLGGVAHKTRETITLLEAAGFEVIIVETLGVGQAETAVKNMTDFFLLLMLAGAGDELQGMKRGIMEMADAIAINKADGDNLRKAQAAQAEYQNALHLFPPHEAGWKVPVGICSAITHKGIAEIWNWIEDYVQLTQKNGYWYKKRQEQRKNALHEHIAQRLQTMFYTHPHVKEQINILESQVIQNQISILQATEQLLSVFLGK
ncbi:MAG: methylmalonyl Co-A mutase-associated GTPase MeaB [Microscillaceae bacterium]|nr:methylmalonyl Co-A mutase-associated GTPase MeaB [Microscillaceae bacterium]MDW8460336.1 methylmalonyl Co-A mutase-associated GTPase MeaB [Cytophagales bacterium]